MAEVPQRQKAVRMSEGEYLAFERSSEIKHEYLNGEVLAMTGASRAHNLISVNLIRMISTQLRERNCDVYPANMRVKIAAAKYTYPDLHIVCGEAQFADDVFDSRTNPTVIIEILSPTTERYDRGEKFQHYGEIESLQNYLLIAQDQASIEGYSRQDGGSWTFTVASGLDARFEIPSINCTLALAEVYERVSLAPAGLKAMLPREKLRRDEKQLTLEICVEGMA